MEVVVDDFVVRSPLREASYQQLLEYERRLKRASLVAVEAQDRALEIVIQKKIRAVINERKRRRDQLRLWP